MQETGGDNFRRSCREKQLWVGKKIGRKPESFLPILGLDSLPNQLELKPHTESHVERSSIRRWFVKVHIQHASRGFEVLIDEPDGTAIEHVEEVSNKAELGSFTQHPRIIRVQIELSKEGRPAQRTT